MTASSNGSVRAVVFDFGGVIITPITDALTEIAGWHDVEMTRMLDVLMGPRETSTRDHPWHRAERGELAIAEMQAAVGPWARDADISLRGDEYERLLRGDFDVHPEVVERVASLRSDGYRTGLLTNSLREFRPHLAATVDLELFDAVVDSSEVGARKPESAIFELTTERIGVDASAILYLDDFAANVAAADAAGWTTIHVTGRQMILPAIETALAG